MLQRIQTVYMVLAIVCVVLGLCNPIGQLTGGDGGSAMLYNLWLSLTAESGVTEHVVMPWAALFALLVLVASILTVNIFLFKKRALQMRICSFAMLILVGYYLAGVAFLLLNSYDEGASLMSCFRPTVWGAMPFVAIILTYLAFRGILKDQLLIKSLDRLR